MTESELKIKVKISLVRKYLLYSNTVTSTVRNVVMPSMSRNFYILSSHTDYKKAFTLARKEIDTDSCYKATRMCF